MTCSFKAALIASTAIIVGAGASAQEDLEARVAQLEAMVAELKAELDRERAETDADLVRVEQKTIDAVAVMGSPAEVSGFKVGDTTLSIGGFVDLDAHVTAFSDGAVAANSIVRDFYIPGATPVGGEETTVTDFTAEATRFFITARNEVAGRKISGRIELDFLGSLQGNQRVSNSFSPRMRLAYLDIDNVRAGQDWSTFQNTSAIPESASFLILSDGMVFERQAQVRYTAGNWQFALENGNATITQIGGARMEADGNLLPDVVARYNHKGEFGNVSFAALARQLRVDMGDSEEDTFGWGLSASGRVNLGERDDLRFNLFGGEGIGRYVGLNAVNGAAVDPADGSLEAIPVYGGLIAWRHPFGETARFNVGYSGLFSDQPDFAAPGSTKRVQSAYAALLWDIAPKVTMGGEVLYGIRELESGADGEISRFTFSTKYAF